MPLLEVRDLVVSYRVRSRNFAPKRTLYAVNGVSFDIAAGETLGLVGESGCGKSTLGKALVRLEKPASGSIRLEGKELAALSGRELKRSRGDIQMVFQDPYGSLNPRLKIAESLDEVIAMRRPGKAAERRARAEELLAQVGLPPDSLDRYPHQFSGGQRQRIGIARALAGDPKLIVADEPVSALDVSVQAAIVNLLMDIQRECGMAFLFIAHDLAVVEHISNRIMVMYLGRIVEIAPARELVASPRHPYTKALLAAVPTLSPGGEKKLLLEGDVPSPIAPPPGCPFHPRCPRAQARCRTELPPLEKCGGGRACACFFPEN
ncbi:MAG: dipeptide ABC transporter ATP-binding protein [Lentisphaeria bacterium]|nr:dipeptide ABC transporter ATP-binding protein [Lentisphaeria bacterium]